MLRMATLTLLVKSLLSRTRMGIPGLPVAQVWTGVSELVTVTCLEHMDLIQLAAYLSLCSCMLTHDTIKRLLLFSFSLSVRN